MSQQLEMSKILEYLVFTSDLSCANFSRAGQKTTYLKLKLKLRQQKSCQTFAMLHYSMWNSGIRHFRVLGETTPRVFSCYKKVWVKMLQGFVLSWRE